jgi:hypothetical protein
LVSWPKVPSTPPAALTRHDDDVVDGTDLLWNINRTTGAHVMPWNMPRRYGPIPSMRWDPHPEPTRSHDSCGVIYVSTTVATVVAEVFQDRRVIDITRGQGHLPGLGQDDKSALGGPGRPEPGSAESLGVMAGS